MRPEIYRVEVVGNGFIAVMAKPVPEWLDDEISGLYAEGVRRVVSLLEPHEEYELGLQNEAKACVSNSIEFISYPIRDRGLPNSVSTFTNLTKSTYHESFKGSSTVIHCRAGIGRSGLVAAGVLLHCGFNVSKAFSHISQARRVQVPDTEQQEEWLHENSTSITAKT